MRTPWRIRNATAASPGTASGHGGRGATGVSGWRSALAAALALTTLAMSTPALAADASLFEEGSSLLQGYSVSGGVFAEMGSGELSGWKYGHSLSPVGMGFRYYERNGFISGTIAAIAVMVGGAAAASGPKSTQTWESGGYRYTRTTYYSPAERAAMTAATASAAAGLFGSANQSFDLQIYSRQVGGNSEGYRVNMMLWGMPFADGSGMFDLGFGWGDVRSAVGESGKFLIAKYHYLGMPLRLSYAFGPVVAYGHFDWNWYGHATDTKELNNLQVTGSTSKVDTTGFPWRFGAQTAVLGRVYAEAAVTTPNLTSLSFGTHISLGARF